MRILYVLDEFESAAAGTEGQFLELVAGVRAANISVAVALLRPAPALERELPGVPIETIGLRSLRSPGAAIAIWRLLRWARANGSGLAHLFFNDSAIACPIPLRLAGIPVIVSRRDLGFWYTPLTVRLLRLNRRAVSSVVVNCSAVKREVLRQERYPEAKIVTIYNGWRSRPISSDRLQVRSALGVPPLARMLLIVANLRPLKRIDDAIRILALTQETVSDVWLAVVGADRIGSCGSESDRLTALARGLGVAERVVFAGPRDDPWPVISACDIGLLCSESEGLSNTLIEYCAAGKPVVCTLAGGNAEVVCETHSGFLFPVGDVRQAAIRVAQLLRDPELAIKMGANGRERIAKRFSAAAMIQNHLTLYASVAGKTPLGHMETGGSLCKFSE